MNALEQLEKVKKKLNYVEYCLKYFTLEAWEIKEYKELVLQYQKEIRELKNHIKNNKQLFV